MDKCGHGSKNCCDDIGVKSVFISGNQLNVVYSDRVTSFPIAGGGGGNTPLITAIPISIDGTAYPAGSTIDSILALLGVLAHTETITNLVDNNNAVNVKTIGTYTNEAGTPQIIQETVTGLGVLSLTGTTLTIPYTDENQIVTNRTVNLSTLLNNKTPQTSIFSALTGNTITLPAIPLSSEHVVVYRNGPRTVDFTRVGATLTFTTPFGNSGQAQPTERVIVDYFT